ncbi:MAG: hypothetical protein ABIA63_14600 [bacterium]
MGNWEFNDYFKSITNRRFDRNAGKIAEWHQLRGGGGQIKIAMGRFFSLRLGAGYLNGWHEADWWESHNRVNIPDYEYSLFSSIAPDRPFSRRLKLDLTAIPVEMDLYFGLGKRVQIFGGAGLGIYPLSLSYIEEVKWMAGFSSDNTMNIEADFAAVAVGFNGSVGAELFLKPQLSVGCEFYFRFAESSDLTGQIVSINVNGTEGGHDADAELVKKSFDSGDILIDVVSPGTADYYDVTPVTIGLGGIGTLITFNLYF